MGILIGGLLGFFIFRNFLGILFGILLGSMFLQSRTGSSHFYVFSAFNSTRIRQMQKMYFYTFFTLLGKMAKADGTISKQEGDYLISLIRQFNLNPEHKSSAIHYFNNAKNEAKSIEDLAIEFHQLFRNAPQVERQLLYQLAGMASVDGTITSEEEHIIKTVATVFSITQSELNHILRSFQASTEQSYHVLGVSKNADNSEIKRSYKKLVKEYHPDMLKYKGMSPSMIKAAEKRFLEIQSAWDAIRKERNIA